MRLIASSCRDVPPRTLLLPMFVLAIAISAHSCSIVDQIAALQYFYNSTGGSTWTVSTGWSSKGPNACSWRGIQCNADGLVSSIYLPFNNLTGDLDSILNPALGCSLTSLQLQGNAISGTLPANLTSVLSQLQSLNIASNSLTGPLPPELFDAPSSGGAMTLEYLDLSWNMLTGPLPSSLCPSADSTLVNLFLSDNQLSGTLNLTGCVNLVLFDVSMNSLIDGSVEAAPSGALSNSHLSVAFLLGTNVADISSLISSAPRLSSLEASDVLLPTLPQNIGSLQSLISLQIFNTYMNGSVSASLFQINNLQKVGLYNNWLSGSIPAVTNAKSLSNLDLSFNLLSGTIPPSLVTVLGNRASSLDLRLNFLSCCGVPPLLILDGSVNVTYGSYNLSMPRLPPGLKFSSTLRPVTYSTLFDGLFTSFMINLGNSSYPGLLCPNFLLSGDADTPNNFLDWQLDPEYYLYEGCQCVEGRRKIMVPFNGFNVMQCVDPLPQAQQWYQQYPWIIALIAIIGILFLSLLFWSIYSAWQSARKQRELLKATQEANAKLEEEKVKMETLLARQFDLLKCFDQEKKGKSGMNKKNSKSAALSLEAIEAVKRNMNADNEVSGEAIENQIELHQVIGEGSYGKVYRGLWRGTLVAVKMMVLPAHMSGQEKREKMAVMEAAISSTLSHPNIVTTYTYSIKPCEDLTIKKVVECQALVIQGVDNSLDTSYANIMSKSKASTAHTDHSMTPSEAKDYDDTRSFDKKELKVESTAMSTTRAGSSSDPLSRKSQGLTYIHSYEVRLVIEFCDRGTLRQALDTGCFFDNSGLNYAAILETARDVASAMAHIHMAQILHSDLKASNILLKSDGTDPRGFVAKVADFGLALKMDHGETHASGMFQGTLSHMAPEVMLHGKQSKAADVYSFGVFLWELFTASHPYKGVNVAHIGHYVTTQGKRPEWPRFCPQDLKNMSERCWEQDPEARPSFDEVYKLLVEMRKRESSKTRIVVLKDPQSSVQAADKAVAPSIHREPAALSLSNSTSSSPLPNPDRLAALDTTRKASTSTTTTRSPPPARSVAVAMACSPAIILGGNSQGSDLSPALSGELGYGEDATHHPFSSIHLPSNFLHTVPEELEEAFQSNS